MTYTEFTGKTVEEAVTAAMMELSATSDTLVYEVIDKGSAGIFGIGSKNAVIKAAKKCEVAEKAQEFLQALFKTMDIEVEIEYAYDEAEKELGLELIGDDMGILIGKRGQTLDSLQYLTSLVINKGMEEHIRVKLDIENYRERREQTLESLAKNIAKKVKKTQHPVKLEPMNPYERRVIHSVLQNDRYVTTSSEGEEPYRYVVVSLKREKPAKSYRD